MITFDAIERVQQARLTGGGLMDRSGTFTSAVRLFGPAGIVIGSGVLIAPRWVLTAAHVIRGSELRIDAQLAGMDPRVPAIRAVWASGSEYRFASGASWPSDAWARVGNQDELALVEFERDIADSSRCATIEGVAPPVKDDVLFFSGMGLNEDGNYEKDARIATLRFIGHFGERHERGLAYRDTTLAGSGEPQKDDSGAPIFALDTKGSPSQRLVGIHTSRTTASAIGIDSLAPGQVVCRYIPVGEREQSWIEATTASIARSRSLSSAFVRSSFCYRQQYECLTFESALDFKAEGETKSVWHLGALPSPRLVHLCDRIEIEPLSDTQATMRIYSCGEPNGYHTTRTMVVGGIGGGQGHHWLVSDDAESEPKRFYIYLKPSRIVDGKLRRRIHFEVFVRKTPHWNHQPSAQNIAPGACEPPVDLSGISCVTCPIPVALMVGSDVDDDQDDEGEGYED